MLLTLVVNEKGCDVQVILEQFNRAAEAYEPAPHKSVDYRAFH